MIAWNAQTSIFLTIRERGSGIGGGVNRNVRGEPRGGAKREESPPAPAPPRGPRGDETKRRPSVPTSLSRRWLACGGGRAATGGGWFRALRDCGRSAISRLQDHRPRHPRRGLCPGTQTRSVPPAVRAARGECPRSRFPRLRGRLPRPGPLPAVQIPPPATGLAGARRRRFKAAVPALPGVAPSPPSPRAGSRACAAPSRCPRPSHAAGPRWAPARGAMSVVTGGSEAAGGPGGGNGARVFFQSPRGGPGGSPGSSREDSAPVATAAAAAGQVQQQQRRHQQGKVTVKYDRKELRKRLVLEEWIVEQLGQLYGCEVPGRRPGRVGTRCAARPPWILGAPAARAHRALSPGVLGRRAQPAVRTQPAGFSCRAPGERGSLWRRWGVLGPAKLIAFRRALGASGLQR